MEELMKEFEENMTEIEEGMIIEGEIYSFGKDDVIVALNHIYDGIVPRMEIDENDLVTGNKLMFEIVKIDDEEGRIILSRKGAFAIEVIKSLENCIRNETPIQVRVEEIVKGGLRIEHRGIRGFMPFSQIDMAYIEDASEYIDQILDALILEWNEDDKNLVVSRRKLLEKEKSVNEEAFFETIKVDQTLEGTVFKLFKSGALIDLGSTMGYLHITDASWTRIKDMEELLKVGDAVKVQIKSINKEDKKISLSLKDITLNPWQTVNDDYEVGDIAFGKVLKDIGSGLLVELETGVVGYIHKSEIGNKKFEEESEITVEIERIDQENEKIGLKYFDEDTAADDYEVEEKENTTLGDIFGEIFDKIK